MDPTEDLLAEVLDRPVEQWSAALEDLCSVHVAVAPELRRRFAVLRRMGVADEVEPSSATSADEPFPERFGPYRLVERLGGGGMGVVYLARHEDLGRNVALKLVRPERLYFTDSRERFRREIEAVARLEHPGCVQIHQVGEAQGVPYFAMEHIAGISFERLVQALAGQSVSKLTGQDLARALRQGSPRNVETAASELFSGPWSRVCLRLVLAAAEALAHAHTRGVIHRDVKPSNLMLTPEGRVVVIDFGLAVAEGTSRMTRSGAFLGSLPYMAPEQVRGDQRAIDARTDVYALGVCLYELLSLVSPFESASVETTRDRILTGEFVPLRARNASVSADLAVICSMAMDLDPRRRYQNMADFAADLAAVLEHRTIAARPASVVRNAMRMARRHPAAATALTLAAVALGIGPLIVSFAIAGQRDRAVEAERLAVRRAYAANVAAANAALLAGNGSEARQRLDACPEAARGFEWRHLDLALGGALLTLDAHRAKVSTVALATDGRKIASGAENGEVALFDAATGTRLHLLQTGQHAVLQLEFDRGATELYANSGGHLRVFDVATGALRRERAPSDGYESVVIGPAAQTVLVDLGGGRVAQIDPHTLSVTSEITLEAESELPSGFFLTDGRRLVAAMRIGGVTTWDVATGQLLGQVRVPHGLSSMCVQPDLSRAACADREGRLTWVDLAASTAHSLDAGGRSVRDLALTADGRLLVAGCDSGDVLVFDLSEGQLVRSLYGHRGPVRAMALGTENSLLLTGGEDGTVRLWSPLLAPEVLDLRGFGASASLVTDGGDRVFHGNSDGLLRCIDARTGKVLWQSQHPHWVNAIAFARNGSVVVSSYHTVLRFCDAVSGTQLGAIELEPEVGYAAKMAVDAGGNRVFLGTRDGYVVAVDVALRTVLASAKLHEGAVFGVTYVPAADTVMTGGEDGRIIELRGTDFASPRVIAATGSPISSIALDGDHLLCSEEKRLCRRDRHSGEILQSRPCPNWFNTIVVLGDDRLVTASEDGRVGFWDRRELELMLELKQPARSAWLTADARARWLAVSGIGGDPRILYAESATGGTFDEQQARACVAAARELVLQTYRAWPWSPAAQRVIAARSDLSAELRATALRMLPLPGLWLVSTQAARLAQSTACTVKEIEPFREMLDEAIAVSADDPLRFFASVALGLVQVRLGHYEAALHAVRHVSSENIGAQGHKWCFVRALSYRKVGDHAAAAAATAELRARVAGPMHPLSQAEALGFLREIELAAR